MHGEHMAVGGRDKRAALYHVKDVVVLADAKRGSTTSEPAWEAHTTDSVYAVAATPDMAYCAFGGTSKTVTVVNGRTGEVLFTHTGAADDGSGVGGEGAAVAAVTAVELLPVGTGHCLVAQRNSVTMLGCPDGAQLSFTLNLLRWRAPGTIPV